MDTRDGRILPMDQVPPLEKEHFVPIRRDLTERERMEKQIALYSPCGCGSGKNFKFCCYKGEKK